MQNDTLNQISEQVKNVLSKNQSQVGNVIDFDFDQRNFHIFDFTENNLELTKLDLSDQNLFEGYVSKTLKDNDCRVGIGRYAEDRIIYRRSKLFAKNEEARSLHLGIDIWSPAGEIIYAPLDGVVHSYRDNAQFGDYGPTIILEHCLEGVKFYTLYGHLSRESLSDLFVRKNITKGEQIATIGEYGVNGNWPAHVHFEIIVDIQDNVGDFPGVARPSESDKYLKLCPNPNIILKIGQLN